jgi:predicted Zn finger-like uncharacterized protein
VSLAARCPACGTVFRVVQDQLRVSEGWVRCGRCAEVFNAIEGLVDVETPVTTRQTRPQAERERVLGELSRVAQASALREPAPAAAQRAVTAYDEQPAVVAAEDDETPSEPAFEPTRAPAEPPPPAPQFVRRAELAARWKRPGVQAALAAACVVGAFGLLAQSAFAYRNTAAVRWPALQPLLAAGCSVFGCTIEAPRAIESLAVESSGLVRIEGTPLYRLSVMLRNRAAWPLAVPSLDLTLTDTQGAVIARRVVRPAELSVTQASVPAAAELAMQGTLAAAERPVSGYTIEIFYP